MTLPQRPLSLCATPHRWSLGFVGLVHCPRAIPPQGVIHVAEGWAAAWQGCRGILVGSKLRACWPNSAPFRPKNRRSLGPYCTYRRGKQGKASSENTGRELHQNTSEQEGQQQSRGEIVDDTWSRHGNPTIPHCCQLTLAAPLAHYTSTYEQLSSPEEVISWYSAFMCQQRVGSSSFSIKRARAENAVYDLHPCP